MREVYALHLLMPLSVPEPALAAEPNVEPAPMLGGPAVSPQARTQPIWELAQAYVRSQPLEGVFTPAEGLRRGTIFPNLSQPYHGFQTR